MTFCLFVQLGTRDSRGNIHRVRLPFPVTLLLDLRPRPFVAVALLCPQPDQPDPRGQASVSTAAGTRWFSSRSCEYRTRRDPRQLDHCRTVQRLVAGVR